MNNFKKGTPAFGMVLGVLFALIGLLLMTLGFWKCVLLVCLFGLGYLLGAVDNLPEFFKTAANRVVPEKKIQMIDMKKEVTREQADQMAAMRSEAAKAQASVQQTQAGTQGAQAGAQNSQTATAEPQTVKTGAGAPIFFYQSERTEKAPETGVQTAEKKPDIPEINVPRPENLTEAGAKSTENHPETTV